MTNYRLKPCVRACIDGANLVFLDLRRDRYWNVPVRTAPRICGVTHATAGGDKSAARLAALGLIEETDVAALPMTVRPRAPDQRFAAAPVAKATAQEAARFAIACLAASHTMQSRRLDRAFGALARRKVQIGSQSPYTARAVGAFETLRPWYPRARVCLFDALALMRFLLGVGVSPTLVMGVRTTPFAAHCWLELDGAIVGDRSDGCASFTPIAWF